jgi:hypothetical protein
MVEGIGSVGGNVGGGRGAVGQWGSEALAIESVGGYEG